MSSNPYASPHTYSIAASAAVDERITFIRNTYLHLAAAVGAFVLLQMVMFTFFEPQLAAFVGWVFGTRFSWLLVLGAFMGVSWLADSWAHSGKSLSTQYAGLGLYTFAEAIILSPLLYLAHKVSPGAIPMAATTTLMIFGGLTLFVLLTRMDFSFLRMFLVVAGFAALAFIVASLIFDFGGLGFWFSGAMVVLMSGYILYHTSNVLHHYQTNQHVAAALALFASLGTLFWYVLQLFMTSRE
ncbi:MAG: US12 family protein [Pirellulaceae bacterium]|jgi:FtsH-binding integral membrane protein|nr:US12 family protein [Pirellulaceae bacterium]